MVLLVVSSMAKLGTISGSGQNAAEILKAFPKPVMVIFGINGFDLTTAIGYFGVTFLYIALMAAIHASIIGAEVIAEEERDKTVEFLAAKPVSRSGIVSQKLAAGIVNLLILNLATLAASVWSVDYYGKGVIENNLVLTMMIGLALMQLLFFALGAFMAAVTKNPKLPIVEATSVLLATYIIWVIIDLNSSFDILKYATPFKYFDAKMIIDSGHLDPVYTAISVVLTVIMIFVTYFAYNRRDLKV